MLGVVEEHVDGIDEKAARKTLLTTRGHVIAPRDHLCIPKVCVQLVSGRYPWRLPSL